MVDHAPVSTPPGAPMFSTEDILAPPLLKLKSASTAELSRLHSNQASLPASLFPPLNFDECSPTSDLPDLRFLKPRTDKQTAPKKRKSISRAMLTDLKPLGLSFDDVVVVEIKKRRTSRCHTSVLFQESRAQQRIS